MSRTWFALLLLLAVAPAGAQEEAVLTEAELLAAVGEDHPAAAALLAEREVAAAEVVRAALLPNPAVEVTREEPDPSARETAAVATWTPPFGGRRALRREAAERGLAAAEGRLAAGRLRLRLALRAAYAGWALAAERRDLAAAHLARVGELARRARARAEAGEIPGLAARRLTLEEGQARADLALAEAELAGRRAEVAAWLPALSAGARPASPTLPAAAEIAPAAALAARADLLAREREVERAEALRRLAGRVVDPPALGLGWKRVEQEGDAHAGPVASVGWTVPLFDRRQADRREAEARLAGARAELSLARARAEAELAGALAAYERLSREAGAAEAAAAETDAVLAGASAAFELGEADLTDFLDSLRAALASRTTSLALREAALAAERALEAAAGRPVGSTPAPGELP